MALAGGAAVDPGVSAPRPAADRPVLDDATDDRAPITLLDVTLRDGGYINDHRWTPAQAAALTTACARAGVGIVEAGYYRPRLHSTSGRAQPAACCPPAYLETLAEAAGDATVAVMVQPGDASAQQLADLARSGVRLVRLTSRVDAVAGVAGAVEAIHAAGMSVSVNLVRISEWDDAAVAAAAATATVLGADLVYLADSNGSLFPERTLRLFEVAREATPVTLGLHAHDGLSLAFANALAAVAGGAAYLDASLGGMGKGGGNLALELISAYLHHRHGMPSTMAPLARALEMLPAAPRDPRIHCGAIAASLLDLNIDRLAALAGEGDDPVRLLDGVAPMAGALR